MSKFLQTLTSGVVLVLTLAFSASAQTPGQPASPFQTKPIVPLRVQIVISRYQGEKRVSNLPYILTVNANDGVVTPDGRFTPFNIARLRTGANIPVPAMATPKELTPGPGPIGPVQYKSIGTNIDCTARSTDDGRFRVEISIEDTSVYADGQTADGVPKFSDIPSFRTFQSGNTVILRDGQSTQFTAAADKVSGEITKVDVTISVEK